MSVMRETDEAGGQQQRRRPPPAHHSQRQQRDGKTLDAVVDQQFGGGDRRSGAFRF